MIRITPMPFSEGLSTKYAEKGNRKVPERQARKVKLRQEPREAARVAAVAGAEGERKAAEASTLSSSNLPPVKTREGVEARRNDDQTRRRYGSKRAAPLVEIQKESFALEWGKIMSGTTQRPGAKRSESEKDVRERSTTGSETSVAEQRRGSSTGHSQRK